MTEQVKGGKKTPVDILYNALGIKNPTEEQVKKKKQFLERRKAEDERYERKKKEMQK